jgi:hypothetical protein
VAGSIDDLVHKAEELYIRYGDSLSEDRTVRGLLSEYQNNIDATYRLMHHGDIVKTCSACATEKAGSCCMQDVEEWYDPVLLLINLLMGVKFPASRELSGHCIFVGNRGCKLIARYPFCVNYLCPRLKDLLGPAQTQHLMTVAGNELFSGWETETYIHNWLNSHSPT